MADISMCSGLGCEKRETCYRFKAIPHPEWQSYIMPLKEDGTCDDHIPMNTDSKKEKTAMTST